MPGSKKPSSTAKRRMKAFDESETAIGGSGWPHPSLDGEVRSRWGDLDEHNQTDILTWGLNLAPAFPIATRFSGLWEFVARYSGATVLDFHEVP